MSEVKSVKLSNGVELPAVGFGCAFGNWTGTTEFQGFLPDDAWRAITLAIDAGYRHFDCAHAYGTERHLGDIIGRKFASGELTRSDVFLTTKIAHPHPSPDVAISRKLTWNARDVPDIAQKVKDDYDDSLQKAGVGYFDLLLMHWPGAFDEMDPAFARKARAEIWGAFEGFLKLGTAKAIGVCNFTRKHLEELMEDCSVKPMVNQIELHPYCQDEELVSFCTSNNIVIEAFAPFASGAFGLLQDETIKKVAEEVGRSAGQVILRWHVQKGHVILPKSSSLKRMKENLAVFDFELSKEQMDAISSLQTGEPQRTCADPATIV